MIGKNDTIEGFKVNHYNHLKLSRVVIDDDLKYYGFQITMDPGEHILLSMSEYSDSIHYLQLTY